MALTAVPQACTRLDIEWFDQVLSRPGSSPACSTAPVTGVEFETLAVAGAAGELARVRLSYGPGIPGPASVIAKFRGTSPTQQAMEGALGLFDRERHVYDTGSTWLPVALPRCYHAGDGHQEPLLLEDLSAHRVVDQVAGLDVADAETVMDTLADLHAAFWDTPIPGGSGWAVSLRDPAFGGMLSGLLASGVSALVERYSTRLPAAVVSAVADAAPHWVDVLARCDDGPRTLVHNDCRADNLFFDPAGTPILIDWQIPAHTRGTQDVAYLISGSLQPHTASEHWRALLERYHGRLGERGVRDYPWAQCELHYRQSAPGRQTAR